MNTLSAKHYGDITHLVVEHRYHRGIYSTYGFAELVVYFTPRNGHTFEYVRLPFPARVITTKDANPVIEYEISESTEGTHNGSIDGITNVTVSCSPEFLAQAQVAHTYLPGR